MGIIPKSRTGRPAAALATAAVGVALLGAACSSAGTPRATAVTPVFPVTAIASALVGPRGPVTSVTPPGVEPHDVEATSTVVDAILDADVAVVVGQGFQPAVESAAARRNGPTVNLLDDLDAGRDPHLWLDPVLMRRVVTLLESSLTNVAPGNRVRLAGRADRLRRQLVALDRAFAAGLAECDRRVIVTAHQAFGRLAARYGLRAVPIAGVSPEQEPDPRRMGELVDLVAREGVTTVFTERAVSTRVGRTLAREAGVRTAVLDPLETPPTDGRQGFDGYLAAMRRNLVVLQRALGCRPG